MKKFGGGKTPATYDYHGRQITIREAAELAGMTTEGIKYRLKKNGGDMDMAIDGKRPDKSSEDAACDEILNVLIAIGSRLKVLQKNVAKAQRLMREAVDDLKDADMPECSHCRHYQKMDVQKCEKSDCDCGECKEECTCRYCTNNQHWEWRGFFPEEEVTPNGRTKICTNDM